MKARNYGIDALKIACMYMVVILHVLGHGGVLQHCDPGISKLSAQTLQAAAFCAVNLFGMTTGYLMIGRKAKCARIVELWLQVVFYGIVITLLAKFAFGVSVPLKMWLSALLPVIFKTYWYFSAYFALFFLTPFLNKMLNSLSRKQSFSLATVLLLLIIISTFSPEDLLYTHDGYSLIWLCILYIMGALLRKYEQEVAVKSFWLLLGYLLMVALTILSQPVIGIVTKTLGISLSESLLLQYDSVTVVAMAVFLMLLFSRMKLPVFFQKVMATLAPLSFAVYIIHEQPIIRANLIEDRFIFLTDQHWTVMILGVLLSAAAIYTVCSAIEFVRLKLFGLLRINKLSEKLGNVLDRVFCPTEADTEQENVK